MKKCLYLVGLLVCVLFAGSIKAQTFYFTTSPANDTVCSGGIAKLFVATSPAADGYRWQYSADGGTTWVLLNDNPTYTGSFTDTLTINASTGLNGYLYSCLASSGVADTTSLVGMLRVDTLPGPISTFGTLCAGSMQSLTDGVAGGTWSSSNADVDSVSASGTLYAIGAGTDSVAYTLSNSCGTNTVKEGFNVLVVPTTSIITGTLSLCINGMTMLADSAEGGVWSNANNTVDTISTSGTVYGLSAGSDSIKYTITNMCGTAVAATLITVDSRPSPISGASLVCVGSSISLSDSLAGGTWFHNGSVHDSVSASGVVYGISVGTDTIGYTVTNACGNDTVNYMITIGTTPLVGAISGPTVVCVGAPVSFSETTTGGTWSNHNTSLDTISSMGVDYALHYGFDSLFYSVTNGCGTTKVHFNILADTMLAPAVISGPSGVCVGSTIILTKSVTGGVWSHVDSLADTLHGLAVAVITGRAAGLDTVYYTRSNSCGIVKGWHTVQVDTLNAGMISGIDVICAGTTDTLMDPSTAGMWSTFSSSIATVNANGVLSALSAGIDTVYYSISNSCGTRQASMPVFVKPAPNAGMIYGSNQVCVGSSVNIYDTVLHDTLSVGAWSNRHSSLDNIAAFTKDSVMITAVAAGIDTISFSVTNSCGTAVASYVVSMDTLTHPTAITGANHVCVGASTTLMSMPAGGIWISNNSAIGTIDAMGNLTGVAFGADTIYYAYTNACGTDTVKTADSVYSLPDVGVISGAGSVCMGGSVTLSESVSGGTWSATNTLGSITSGGVFMGTMSGIDTVYYAVSNTHCIGKAAMFENIDTLPVAYPITGPSNVCTGGVILLENANTWGTHLWYTTNGKASITTTGLLSGMASGSDTVIYAFANACGVDTESYAVTIQSPLTSGLLVGPAFVCQGSSVTFTDTLADGVWLSGSPYIASIDATSTYSAVITGRHVGTSLISYTFWNACGAVTDTQTISVFGEALPIGGVDSVGVGGYRTLTNTTPGGVWSSTNTLLATVDVTGKVHGLLAGLDTIMYTVTNPCGTSVAFVPMQVGNKPSAGAIFGIDTVCAGLNINLGDTAILGGTWSTSNAKAEVDAYGIVTGVNGPGLDTVSYSVTNGFGSGVATKKIYVNSVPVVSVHHYNLVVLGGQYPLLDTPATGTWWSSDYSSITFAGGKMIVIAPSHDTVNWNDTLIYTVTNLCGVTRDTLIYFLPNPHVLVENVPNPVSSVNVFPNPGNGSFTLHFGSEISETANVVISNIMGQKVIEFTVQSNTLTPVTIDQADGVYLLSAYTATARFDIKVVVTH